jgi:hypothetical protein
VNNWFNWFIGTITRPFSSMNDVATGRNANAALVFGGIYLFIIFFAKWINKNIEYDKGFGPLFGLIALICTAMTIALMALFSYLFNKDNNKSYKNMMSVFCTANIYTCLAMLVYMIFAIFSDSIAFVIEVAAFTSWCVLSTYGLLIYIKGTAEAQWFKVLVSILAVTYANGLIYFLFYQSQGSGFVNTLEVLGKFM